MTIEYYIEILLYTWYTMTQESNLIRNIEDLSLKVILQTITKIAGSVALHQASLHRCFMRWSAFT
jgi:hypothetical protein